MQEKKYYIAFDGYERGVMVNALNEMRNALLQQGRYTDAVDEVILKVIDAKTKKFKVTPFIITSPKKSVNASHPKLSGLQMNL